LVFFSTFRLCTPILGDASDFEVEEKSENKQGVPGAVLYERGELFHLRGRKRR